jgi:hypothetical protein
MLLEDKNAVIYGGGGAIGGAVGVRLPAPVGLTSGNALRAQQFAQALIGVLD